MSVNLLISSGFLLVSGLLMKIFSRPHSAMQFIGWCFLICGAVPVLYTWGKEMMGLLNTMVEKTPPAKQEEKKEEE